MVVRNSQFCERRVFFADSYPKLNPTFDFKSNENFIISPEVFDRIQDQKSFVDQKEFPFPDRDSVDSGDVFDFPTENDPLNETIYIPNDVDNVISL